MAALYPSTASILKASPKGEGSQASPDGTIDWNAAEHAIGGFIANLTGHDGTYGQTIFARKVWNPEDLEINARFVDVLSELEDGRLMIDYGQFHDTIPDREAEAQWTA